MKENLRGMEGRTRGSKLLYREVQKEKNREKGEWQYFIFRN